MEYAVQAFRKVIETILQALLKKVSADDKGSENQQTSIVHYLDMNVWLVQVLSLGFFRASTFR